MKIIMAILLLSYCGHSWASSVAPYDTVNTVVRASDDTNNVTLGMVAEELGAGTAESTPVKTYIPIGGDITREDSAVFANPTLLPLRPADGNGFVTVRLRAKNDSSPNTPHLLAAVRLSSATGDYRTFALIDAITTVGSADSEQYAKFSISEMCNRADDHCTSTLAQASLDNVEGFYNIFFFLSDTNPGVGVSISPTGRTGVFFKFHFSARLPSTTVSMTMSNLYPGDGRLLADLAGGQNIGMAEYLYKTYILNCTAPCAQGGTFAAGGGFAALLGEKLVAPVLNGLLDIKGLQNNTTYNVAVGLTNKYQFASRTSASLAQTPLPIEALLQKQACFLLTAGFHGGHPVVSYFRKVRDEVLMKSGPGRAFVQWYYKSAPPMAPTIHNSPVLSAMIRGAAYMAYYALHALPLLLAGALGILFYWMVRSEKAPADQ